MTNASSNLNVSEIWESARLGEATFAYIEGELVRAGRMLASTRPVRSFKSRLTAHRSGQGVRAHDQF